MGKHSLLLQLAKTDRSPSGKQLLALLSMGQKNDAAAAADNAADDDAADNDAADDAAAAHNTIVQKNAYALLRLKRYKDAAAVFLMTRPVPMVREACSVLSKQYRNPQMAFLVARRMEARIRSSSGSSSSRCSSSSSGSSSTACLGPVARSILMHEILPGLQQLQNDDDVDDQSPSSSSLSSSSLGRCIVAIVGAYWLQSRTALKTAWMMMMMQQQQQRAVMHPLMLLPPEVS